eukprot:scaffold215758_cov13-Tisochrysis_lutea.AAC.1
MLMECLSTLIQGPEGARLEKSKSKISGSVLLNFACCTYGPPKLICPDKKLCLVCICRASRQMVSWLA